MSVRVDVLKAIIAHYPSVPGYEIHRASKAHPFSTCQRLREMRAEGLIDYAYSHATKRYRVFTKKRRLEKVLKSMTPKKETKKEVI